MIAVDGSTVTGALEASAQVVVVGSGPAGSAFALALAEAGVDVLVLEEGPHIQASEYHPDSFGGMRQLYRGMGATVTRSRAPLPVVQGRAVGGTSVINGAISWRLPEDVWKRWIANDPALEETLPWQALQTTTDTIERRLSIRPTPVELTGANDRLMAAGAEALGIDHRPIRRNVRDCEGAGRCLQGCPTSRKQSMDVAFLPAAATAGARIICGAEVIAITQERGSVSGLTGSMAGGGRFTVRCDTVVLAASAVQSPLLLQASGLKRAPVGAHFRAHPGFSMLGRFADPVNAWEGSTQGHEVTGLRADGLKFEALGLDPGMLAARMGVLGRNLRRAVDEDLPHMASWAVALKAQSEGRVKRSWFGPPVRYDLHDADLALARRGIRVLGEMMFAAGAEYVLPGVAGFDKRVEDPSRLAALEEEGPRDPRCYTGVITHLFGSCRMGSDPKDSVVGITGEHHDLPGLYVVDSSIFPTNTGVNPQTSILSVSSLLADRWIREH
ncbi:MAG: GMC family oxidoreductase [Proteobacteria bacterium]|nr:GMC family oxidoreductase [Pseudomonadota bacterium]